MSFINDLESSFQEKGNKEMSFAMEKYMKDIFPFFGIKTDERRKIFKEIWKQNQQEVLDNSREIAWLLFQRKERELHYCAIEILIKNLKNNYQKNDIQLIEKLLITNSWWDSVDTISKYILGEYLLEFPSEIEKTINRFSNSENMWLNRSVLLFQLSYKQKTDPEILFSECKKHSKSNEFFIKKAIGWALREYAKTNSDVVKHFLSNNDLKPLSQKEALKNIS